MNSIQIEIIKSIPYEKEDVPLKEKSKFDMSYPTKVSLFDLKCNKCQFVVYKTGDFVTNDVDVAIDYACRNGVDIVRECSYIQIEDVSGEIYNLSMIETLLSNCIFWDPCKIVQEEKYYVPENAEEILNSLEREL